MKKQEPTKQPEQSLVIERQLGGFGISAALADSTHYRRVQNRLDQVINDILTPYNAERRPMSRTDAAMVCSSLTLQVRAFGIVFERPFSVNP